MKPHAVVFALLGSIAALAALAAGGCGSSRNCGSPPPSDRLQPEAALAPAASPAVNQYNIQLQDLKAAMKRRTRPATGPGTRPGAVAEAVPAGRAFQVLVLSGGGSNGAWGAGFLNGWSKSGQRPAEFDVVTGISTGALLSTGAFLHDDDLVRRAYTTVHTSDIATNRCPLFLPFSDSLQDTAPLARTIKRFLPDDKIREVAKAWAGDRRLYIGTTDLDSGRLVIWDMTKIAADSKYDLYRQVVRASSSVPGLYPPVQLDGHLHADGGVRALLFFRTRMIPAITQLHEANGATISAAAGPASPATGPTTEPVAGPGVRPVEGVLPGIPVVTSPGPMPTIYVIVNGKIGTDFRCTADGLLPIALRAVECLTDANGVADLFQTQLYATQLKYDFRLSFIPDKVPALDSAVFDPKDMIRLFDAAERSGTVPAFQKDVPNLDDDHSAGRF